VYETPVETHDLVARIAIAVAATIQEMPESFKEFSIT
jgi:hypothetical protein